MTSRLFGARTLALLRFLAMVVALGLFGGLVLAVSLLGLR